MLPSNWTKYTTEDGKDYYHNHVSNQTQWDFPLQPLETAITKTLQLGAAVESKSVAHADEKADNKKSTYGVQAPPPQSLFGSSLPCSWCLPSMEFLTRGFNVTTRIVANRVTACSIPFL